MPIDVQETRPATVRDPAAWRLARLPAGGDLASAESFCTAVANSHYENFSVVSLLVPRRLRQDFANVYAFARWSDDLADEAAGPAEACRNLAEWRAGLESCFLGKADHPIYVALASTATRRGLSIEPFSDLLDAFEQDQVKTRYESREELIDYCRRSANPVGRIVLGLEGCRDAALVRLSDAICTGLQLVNFWQDIRRDRLAGRIYVPRDDLRRHGVGEDDLSKDAATTSVRHLVRELVDWSREWFEAGRPLVDVAPRPLRPAITAFFGGGVAVADAIARADYDTLARRPVIGRLTKARLVAAAAWRSLITRIGACR